MKWGKTKRPCKHCDKMFTPTGKYCRVCTICNPHRKGFKQKKYTKPSKYTLRDLLSGDLK